MDAPQPISEPDKKPLLWRLKEGKAVNVFLPSTVRLKESKEGHAVLEIEPLDNPECFEMPGGG